MYAEPYREPKARPPRKKRSLIGDILPALLVIVLVLAGIDYYRKNRTVSEPVDVVPAGIGIVLPVAAATNVGSEGWLLYPESSWVLPSGPAAQEELCHRLVKHLALTDPQSAALIGTEGEMLLRCFP